MNNEVSKFWNILDRDDKLEIIEEGIDMFSVSEGSLFLRLYRKGNTISAYIQESSNSHLMVEAVSQATLSELFSDDHDFEEEDAEIILNWMESQA
jgi:hypothetical protein